MRFEILAESGKGRCGILETAHGEIHTPAFMPVGTAATVKAIRRRWYAPVAPKSCLATPII